MNYPSLGEDMALRYEVLWNLLAVAGPILGAYSFYKGACRYLEAARAREGDRWARDGAMVDV